MICSVATPYIDTAMKSVVAEENVWRHVGSIGVTSMIGFNANVSVTHS